MEAMAVHPRTRVQGFSGRARWEIIQQVKQAVRIPVIGNGDVFKPEDALALREQTGCDAVMIGRAAASNPWIFRQMAEFFATGTYREPADADRYELIRTYYAMLVAEETPGAIGKMKQFASWFTHGVRNGSGIAAAGAERPRNARGAGARGRVLRLTRSDPRPGGSGGRFLKAQGAE